MKFVVVAGAPAVGKTSILCNIIKQLITNQKKIAVAKMDCINSNDAEYYSNLGVPTITGLSNHLCPDHYLATNLNILFDWGKKNDAEMLIVETAGLCNRCAPFITSALNICVIDSTASIKSPEKLGPIITTASIIAITKCDMISQAEREILLLNIKELNPNAQIFIVNGITGSGTRSLAKTFETINPIESIDNESLVYEMPGAICSYCVGETRLGQEYHQGMVEYLTV